MSNKFKQAIQDDGFFYGFVILLIAITSFGLGRLSNADFSLKEPLLLHNSETAELIQKDSGDLDISKSTSVQATEAPTFVGSKNGTKYHFPWCTGAKQIKDENKVYFSTKEEAQASGYTPASNCKGI